MLQIQEISASEVASAVCGGVFYNGEMPEFDCQNDQPSNGGKPKLVNRCKFSPFGAIAITLLAAAAIYLLTQHPALWQINAFLTFLGVLMFPFWYFPRWYRRQPQLQHILAVYLGFVVIVSLFHRFDLMPRSVTSTTVQRDRVAQRQIASVLASCVQRPIPAILFVGGSVAGAVAYLYLLLRWQQNRAGYGQPPRRTAPASNSTQPVSRPASSSVRDSVEFPQRPPRALHFSVRELLWITTLSATWFALAHFNPGMWRYAAIWLVLGVVMFVDKRIRKRRRPSTWPRDLYDVGVLLLLLANFFGVISTLATLSGPN